MSLILGLDFETSGLDPVHDRVLEVGLAARRCGFQTKQPSARTRRLMNLVEAK